MASLMKPMTLFMLFLSFCAWVVTLAGVSSGIQEAPITSDGFLRYEWFLVWFELAALVHAFYVVLGNKPAATRVSSMAFLAIITSISITHTNVTYATIDAMRVSYTTGMPYGWYGVVTKRQLYGARAIFAGLLSWSATNTISILMMGVPAAESGAIAKDVPVTADV